MANLNGTTHQIAIRQHFTYVNQSDRALARLYFNDWNHAYANKNTALAKRFAEEFNKGLHLAKDRERGNTLIKTIVDQNYTGLDWERVGNRDLISVELNQALRPGDSVELFFTYTVQLPSSKFTSYGYTPNGGYNLKDWYLTPTVFDGEEWRLYDNINLDDLHTDMVRTSINISFPAELFMASNFRQSTVSEFPGGNIHSSLERTERAVRSF